MKKSRQNHCAGDSEQRTAQLIISLGKGVCSGVGGSSELGVGGYREQDRDVGLCSTVIGLKKVL